MQQLPEWGFLKFKTVELTDDGTAKEVPTEQRPQWEAKMIRELLNKITPPKKDMINLKKCMRVVSEERTTKSEVKKIGKIIKLILEKYNFPENGICESRHDMYSALFDELIRQVIVDFPELGSILLQIRDHFRLEVWNYEQVYMSSQAYGYRKVHMENTDVRLNKLEAEHKQLLERQDKTAQEVERIHQENLEKEAEINNIVIDEYKYWNEVKFYQSYIRILLHYFDLRGQDAIKEVVGEKILIRLQEEEEVEEESEAEEEGFSLGVEELSEEEEEPPGSPEEDKEIQVELSKPKEGGREKRVVYRKNEEEVFVSDSDTNEYLISESAKTEDDVILDSDTDIFEKLKQLYEEDLKHEPTFSDLERGYIKKAADAYEEEIKRAEALKLEQVVDVEAIEEEERVGEEYMEEEGLVEEEEVIGEKKLEEVEDQEEEEIAASITQSFIADLVDLRGSTKKADSLLNPSDVKPFTIPEKYSLYKRLLIPIKCKDLVPKVPEPGVTRKLKKTRVKKDEKLKPKKSKPTEKAQDVPEELFEKRISDSEFKWGLPLSATLSKQEVNEALLKEKPIEIKQPATVEEESEESSSIKMGETESTPSDDATSSLSIDEEEECRKAEEENKKVKEEVDEEEEEEEEKEESVLFL